MPATDITPRLASGRQLVESYGGGGFTISGQRFPGSVIIFPERVVSWQVTTTAMVTVDSVIEAVTAPTAPSPVQILVIGCGPRFVPSPSTLTMALRARGIASEWMDTGAACRTYNVLLLEGRDVAAALIAVD